MPLRFHIEGHLYYITTVIYGRLPLFTRPSFVVPLLDSLNYYRYQQHFKILGYVIMPDHLHLLVWPQGPASVGDIMRDYKEFTAKRLVRQAEAEGRTEWATAFRAAGQKTGRSTHKVWQDSYWDENVFSEPFLLQKLAYIHDNPVRAGLAADQLAYPYSSARSYELGEEWLLAVDREWFG